MKPIIVDMKDMSDSTEVYGSRPNSFIICFIYLLVAILAVSVVWMWLSPIDIVVKSNGMFKGNGVVYEVSSGVSGTVKSVNVKDGQLVNAGDVLYTIDVIALGETIQYYQNKLDDVDARLNILGAYVKCIDGDVDALNAFIDNKYYQEILSRKALLEANIKNSKDSSTDKIYTLTEKSNVTSEMLSYQEKREEYEKYLVNYDIQNNNCSIKADTSGYFYLSQDVKQGAYVQEGLTIGNIYPKNESGYYAQIYVDNSDIGKIKKGQEVKFEIEAFPSSEYGYFSGKIVDVPKDITIDSGNGSAYYVVKVECDITTDAVSIISGMACQAKVIVDKENVMTYLLEKINLI